MKKLLPVIFFFFFSIVAFAQNAPQLITVKGFVIDSADKQPVSYGTVALQDTKTKAAIKSNTKDDGSFELKATGGKPYELVLTFVGYKNKVLSVSSTDTVLDFGKILLQSSSKKLKEVNIIAVKPLMKQEVDRISYDVLADPESKSLTALDMMRKVPLLSVDASDNIKLKGSGNYKILVNGKESALLAKNPSDVLRSMPGTNIVKIEVITTPPAKYDAEGLAGIINIITTKNVDQGYNIGVNTRYNTIWGPGVNLNGTVKQGKFGFSGYAGMGRQNQVENPFDNTQTFKKPDPGTNDHTVVSQNGDYKFRGNYKYASAELSYEIDTLNLLTTSFDMNTGVNDQANNGPTKTTAGNTTKQGYYQSTTNNSNNKGIDLGINYQLGFKKSKDQLLTLSYQYSYSPNKQFVNNQFTDTINYPNPNYRQYNNAGNREHTFQLDYVQPFKKLTLEAGAKAILRNNFSDFEADTLITPSNNYGIDQTQSNNFTYHQDVYSLYNSYQLKLDKWTTKAGLRIEETTIAANFSSENQTLSKNYGNLIPSFSLLRSLKNSSISLGFTQRIQRPDIYQLNPFVDRSNPQFVSTGNSDLKPELDQVFELNYSYFTKGSVNVGLSYSFSNNSIQNVTRLQTETIAGKLDTITYSTYQNLGSNKNLDITINANYPITTKFSINVNGELAHLWLKGYYEDKLYGNDGFTGNMNANISYKFDDGYRIGLNAGYYSGNVTLQGNSRYFIFNQYVVSKTFLNKNATVSFVANNPYSKYWAGYNSTNTGDFNQINNYEQTYRSFGVRLSYKFGKLNSDIKKNQRGINNDDTKGGNKSNGNQ